MNKSDKSPKKDKSIEEILNPDKKSLLKTYEELLLRKEQIVKEGESYRIAYIQEFGELTAEVFKAKIECIRLKKAIAYCQKALNRGKKINPITMENSVEKEMAVYNDQLKAILRENKLAFEAKNADLFDYNLAKKIYRRLAKKLHPDINKMTEKEPKLTELWNKIMAAYYQNDAERLEELEVLVNAAFKELGIEEIDIDINDLEDRIKALEIKIGLAVNDVPYTYGEFLNDDEKVEAKKDEMTKELNEYKEYALQLEEILADLMMEGGATVQWQTKL